MRPSEVMSAQARQSALPLFEQGRVHFDKKEFEQAAQCFLAALAIHPPYPDALQLLGIVYAQTGRPHLAVSQFKRIVELEPNSARAHNNLGQVQDDLKDFESALASFDRAIALDPHYAAAHTNRADTLTRLPQAFESNRSLPKLAELAATATANQVQIDYMQIAIHLYEHGDKQGALLQMDTWVRAEPKNPLAHHKRAVLLKELRRYHEAMDSFNQAIALNPKNSDAFYERGDILQYHELFDLAKADFKTAIALNPNVSLGYEGLAGVQSAQGLLPEALGTINHALRLNPARTAAQNLRYDLMLDLREHDTLLAESTKRLGTQPQSPETYTKHGKLLTHLRQFETAWQSLQQALRLDDAYIPAKLAMAALLHLQGKWQEAYRFNIGANYVSNTAFLQSFGKPIWTGEQDVRGRTLLIHAELGQGDTILLCRFAILVAKRGAIVILKVQKSLVRLLGMVEGVSLALAHDDPLPAFDFICSTLSLPAMFNVLPSTIPYALQPYLRVKSDWLAPGLLSPPVQDPTKRHVGIVWGGGHSHYNYRRSIPIQKWLPLLQTSNIQFFSFQKDRARQDLEMLGGVQITDVAEQMTDFAATAALVSQMDLVICVDTAIAHLAGALGKPVWMLSRRDHPWLEGRSDNPWYASMRMYTQTDFGNWDEVMARVQQDLHTFTIAT